MNRSRTVILFTAMSAGILATSHSALRAQIPGGPQVISPEVLPDRRVAFRIWAPKAEEVILRGDWMEGTTVERLSRNDEGVWTATVGPLRPDYYSYSLWVDGVRTLDPQNPEVKQGLRSVENMFFLPGEEAEFQAVAPVPHGQVRRIWYSSSTLGTVRRMHVYTPPDYDGTTTSYPVLYLLHGGGDDDSGWSTIGRAGFILDNLLAAGKAQPLLIVMPNGSIPLPAGLPRAAPGETPSEEVRRALAETQKKFVHELMHDVIPYVEAHFRVVDNPSHRALAGLSMGGGQTLEVFATHPNHFAYVAIWSAGVSRDLEAWEEIHADFLKRTPVSDTLRLLSLSAGKTDFALPGAQALSELFRKYRIDHEFQLSEGGHTWLNWRVYLRDLLPRLFR